MLYIKQIIILLLLLFILSCSTGPDVRVVLCRDLTIDLIASAKGINWAKDTIQIKNLDEAQVSVIYEYDKKNTSQAGGKSVCYYRYESEAEVVDEIGAPLSVYSSYPYKMLFNGKLIRGKELVNRINKVMIKQGKAVIKEIEKHVKATADYIKEQN
jgi:hypothetical protein